MNCTFDGDNVCVRCKTPTRFPDSLRQCCVADECNDTPPHFASAAPPPASGPGTELSRLLKRVGIEPTPTCACRAKAAEMDAWGPDECERPERMEEIVAVMRAEAEARGLPFLDAAGRLLVKRAIRNARRAASTPENTQS